MRIDAFECFVRCSDVKKSDKVSQQKLYVYLICGFEREGCSQHYTRQLKLCCYQWAAMGQ